MEGAVGGGEESSGEGDAVDADAGSEKDESEPTPGTSDGASKAKRK